MITLAPSSMRRDRRGSDPPDLEVVVRVTTECRGLGEMRTVSFGSMRVGHGFWNLLRGGRTKANQHLLFDRCPLFRVSQPGVLPPDRHVVVVAAKPNVRPIAITKFQRLMFGDSNRTSASEAGTLLFCERVFDIGNARLSAIPEITVKRYPEPRLKIVTQVPFEGSNWIFRLRFRSRIVRFARSKEPRSGVSI